MIRMMRMMRVYIFRFVTLVSLLVSLLSCADEGSTLYVALITDMVPGAEFTTLRVEIDDRQQTRPAAVGDDFVQGVRVAEFDLAVGEHNGRVVLENDAGDRVAARPFSIEVRPGQQTGTVVISRACSGVTCPAAGNPTATACLAGQCVDPGCSPETPEHCPLPDCFADAECPPRAACAEQSCVSGVCLYASITGSCEDMSYCNPERGCQPLGPIDPDAGMPDAGPRDATPDTPMDAGCECDAGTTQVVVCGRGCTQGISTCGFDCRWGEPECNDPEGAASCWLWMSIGNGWRPFNEPTGGANEPSVDVVAAFDVEAMGEAYLLTNSTYHVLRLSDRQWVASGPLASLLPGLDAPPAHAMSIPATHSSTTRERLELVTTSGQRFFFDHRSGTRNWTAAGSEGCCVSEAWSSESAPAPASVRAAWFDSTNTRNIYNSRGDPLCPAAAGFTGDIPHATFFDPAGPTMHQLESLHCFEFAPPWDADYDEPFGGLRPGPSANPRPGAVGAAFYHESDNSVWVITP